MGRVTQMKLLSSYLVSDPSSDSLGVSFWHWVFAMGSPMTDPSTLVLEPLSVHVIRFFFSDSNPIFHPVIPTFI